MVNPKRFARRFDLAVPARAPVTAIGPDEGHVTVASASGDTEPLRYDRLIPATGTVGVKPAIKGLTRENLFTVRTVPDVDAISAYLGKLHPEPTEAPLRALILGGGYIGLESAERFPRHDIQVTVVEMIDQLMPPLNPEMAEPLRAP